MKPERVRVLGVPVDCVDMTQALEVVSTMLEGSRAQTIIAVNPEKVMKARSDPELLAHLESAGLLIPDGIGIVVAARMLAGRRLRRVPGAELMPGICELASVRGYSVYLLGGDEEVNSKAAEELSGRYPGLKICGRRNGYFSESQESGVLQDIDSKAPDILFVALGSPKQELWMARYGSGLRVKVCQGVGGTLDILAGHVRRAPLVFRKLNLEWLYRLMTQPGRFIRQTALPRFVFQVARAKLSATKHH